MKIVRLGGQFGQWGFKGQAILFAQQVEEVAERLPLSVDQCRLTIVAEKLESAERIRNYSVNLSNIEAALDWLLQNNHLYQNIQIDFGDLNRDGNNNFTDNIITAEVPVTQLDPLHHFTEISPGKSILRGTFHQGCDIFSIETKGKQRTASTAVAIAFSLSKELQT